MTDRSMEMIRDDFDRIALLAEDGWDHNTHYHDFLLQHVPVRCVESLEIGCGPAAFSRLLASRSDRVLAVDLSQNMIGIAKERSREFGNIDFQVRDVLEWELPSDRFDCIVTIATLHHLPMERMLRSMSRALRPDGVLMVLDLFERQGLCDLIMSALALPVNVAMRLVHDRGLRAPREVREAWTEHGRYDIYPTIRQVKELCARLLPGATVRRHLLWRYSVIWKKSKIENRTSNIARH